MIAKIAIGRMWATRRHGGSLRLAAIAAGLLFLTPLPVGAQNLTALFAGSEVRRSLMFHGTDSRFDVWKFSADGTFAGAFFIERNQGSRNDYVEEGRIAGQWRIEGKRLCIDATIYGYAEQACFSLKQTGGTETSVEFQGAEAGTGRRWMFYVAPGG